MAIQVIEVQDKTVSRTYNISGPKLETVQSFWEYLKATNRIESYEIKQG